MFACGVEVFDKAHSYILRDQCVCDGEGVLGEDQAGRKCFRVPAFKVG